MSFSFLTDAAQQQVAKQNSAAMQSAFDKLEIDAEYAGPLSKSETAIVDALWQRGKQGQLPSTAEVGNALKGAAVGVGTVAATGACAPVLGPGATLCGVAAGIVVSAVADVFVGGGEGECEVRVNGVCWPTVRQRYLDVAVDQMAPGDAKGKQDVWNAVNGIMNLIDQRLEWERQQSIKQMQKFGYDQSWNMGAQPQSKAWVPGFVQDLTTAPPPGLSVSEGLSIADTIISRAVVLSRYEAERRFIEGVKSAATTAQAPFLARCSTESCKSSIRGITLQGAYLAGKAMRNPAEGDSAAEMLWSSTRLQNEGVVGNAQSVSDLQKKETARSTAEERAKAQASLAKAQAQLREALDAQSNKKRFVIAAAAVVVVAAFATSRRRRSKGRRV